MVKPWCTMQWGHFTTFLSSRFCVKSIFAILESQKSHFLQFFNALNFDFGKIQKIHKFIQNSKFRASKWVKLAVLGPLNWFHEIFFRLSSTNLIQPVTTQCGKTRNSLSPKIFSSNQLFSNLFSKTATFTKF